MAASEPSTNLRFSTARLFYAAMLSAAATSLFGWFGLPVAMFVILIWWQILTGAHRETARLNQASAESRASFSASGAVSGPASVSGRVDRSGAFRLELAAVLVISAIILGLLVPSHSDSDPMQHAATNMQMIAKAIANYEQEYSQLPTVFFQKTGDLPTHSWRALILREIGEDKLACAYHFDEPWCSLSNRELACYRPWYYRTFYEPLWVRSASAGQPANTSVHLVSFGNDWAVVEHEAAQSAWIEPDPFTLADFNEQNVCPELGAGFWHAGFFASKYRGRLVATRNGVLAVQPGHQLSQHDLLAARGSTPVIVGEPHTELHGQNALRLIIFLAIALYPIRWLKQANRQARVVSTS